MLIAQTAAAAFANFQLIAGMHKVAEQFTCSVIIDNCARRNVNHQVFGGSSSHVAGTAVIAIRSNVFAFKPKALQCIQGR